MGRSTGNKDIADFKLQIGKDEKIGVSILGLSIRNLKFGRNVPRPRLVGGVKGHNINDTSSSGSPALWAGSFKFEIG